MFPSNPIAAVTHPDPYPYYADLATRTPIYRDDTLGLWVAAGADAVMAVLASRACRVRPPNEPVPRALLGSPAAEIFRALVRMNDGAGHCPLKRMVTATLESLDLATAAARSQAWARQLVDELRPQDDRRRLAEIMFRLPVYVIADLLGAPRDQAEQIARWMGDFVRCLAPSSTAGQIERGKLAAGQLREMMRGLLIAAPPSGAGLLAVLADQARRAGCDDSDVIVANAIGLLSQAYEATAGLIGNTLVALARWPELHTQMLDDPGLLSFVISHVLHYDPPIQNTRRFLAEDALVAGQVLRAGDVVLVVLAAANHDPVANPAPDLFAPFQTGRRSFTFGAGVHACPGAALATVIAQAGVAELLAAGLDLVPLAETVTYRPSANARVALWHREETIQ